MNYWLCIQQLEEKQVRSIIWFYCAFQVWTNVQFSFSFTCRANSGCHLSIPLTSNISIIYLWGGSRKFSYNYDTHFKKCFNKIVFDIPKTNLQPMNTAGSLWSLRFLRLLRSLQGRFSNPYDCCGFHMIDTIAMIVEFELKSVTDNDRYGHYHRRRVVSNPGLIWSIDRW